MTPNEASNTDRLVLINNVYGKLNKYYKNNFRKIGQHVRKVYKKTIFDKGYYPNWTDQTFEITSKSRDKIPLYKIKNEKNMINDQRFYAKQIQDIVPNTYRIEKIIRSRNIKGKTQHYVKWLNHGNEYNSWVNAEEIINL